MVVLVVQVEELQMRVEWEEVLYMEEVEVVKVEEVTLVIIFPRQPQVVHQVDIPQVVEELQERQVILQLQVVQVRMEVL